MYYCKILSALVFIVFFSLVINNYFSENFLIKKKLAREIKGFVESAFNADGSYNLERKYPAIAGKNNKHCKWCEFKDQPDLCAKAERLKG